MVWLFFSSDDLTFFSWYNRKSIFVLNNSNFIINCRPHYVLISSNVIMVIIYVKLKWKIYSRIGLYRRLIQFIAKNMNNGLKHCRNPLFSYLIFYGFKLIAICFSSLQGENFIGCHSNYVFLDPTTFLWVNSNRAVACQLVLSEYQMSLLASLHDKLLYKGMYRERGGGRKKTHLK